MFLEPFAQRLQCGIVGRFYLQFIHFVSASSTFPPIIMRIGITAPKPIGLALKGYNIDMAW